MFIIKFFYDFSPLLELGHTISYDEHFLLFLYRCLFFFLWLLYKTFLIVIFTSLLLVALVILLDGMISFFEVFVLTNSDKCYHSSDVVFTLNLKIWFIVILIFSLAFRFKMTCCFSERVFMMSDLILFSSRRYLISSFKHCT